MTSVLPSLAAHPLTMPADVAFERTTDDKGYQAVTGSRDGFFVTFSQFNQGVIGPVDVVDSDIHVRSWHDARLTLEAAGYRMTHKQPYILAQLWPHARALQLAGSAQRTNLGVDYTMSAVDAATQALTAVDMAVTCAWTHSGDNDGSLAVSVRAQPRGAYGAEVIGQFGTILLKLRRSLMGALADVADKAVDPEVAAIDHLEICGSPFTAGWADAVDRLGMSYHRLAPMEKIQNLRALALEALHAARAAEMEVRIRAEHAADRGCTASTN